jgi:hypothetical protein
MVKGWLEIFLQLHKQGVSGRSTALRSSLQLTIATLQAQDLLDRMIDFFWKFCGWLYERAQTENQLEEHFTSLNFAMQDTQRILLDLFPWHPTHVSLAPLGSILLDTLAAGHAALPFRSSPPCLSPSRRRHLTHQVYINRRVFGLVISKTLELHPYYSAET